VKIDKDWNLNKFVLGKTTEQDFVSSSTNQGFEKMLVLGSNASNAEISYNNEDQVFYFYFAAGQGNGRNAKINLLKGYNLQDFKVVDISFENGDVFH